MNRRPAPVTWGVLALLLALGLTACGAGGGAADKSTVADAGSGSLRDTARAPDTTTSKSQPAAAVSERAVISTGTVDLTSKDVAEIRDRVISVLEAHDGVLADERTTTDEKGRTSYAQLVLRVPAEDFAAVMDQLAGLARLVDSSRKSEDVTTEVIDVDQRVEVQRRGLRRTVQLLDRAGSLADVLKIEDEITRRRADLDSLVGQQRYLRSQTSLSTITVTVDRRVPARVEHAGGFVGGLRSGWGGLTALLGWVVTAVGTLLPFTLLLVVLAPLALLVRRALRGRGDAPEPAQPTS